MSFERGWLPRLLFVVGISSVFMVSSWAQTVPAGSERSGEENSLSVGVGVIASARPYPNTDPEIFPVPVVTGRYDRFFFQGIRGGMDLFQKDAWSANIFAQARFQGLEPEESPFLEGMSTRQKSADAGLELSYRGRPVGFRTEILTDVLGRSKGQEASFQVTSGVPLGRLGLILAGFGPRWVSSNVVDYYFGVGWEEIKLGRPAYTGESALNWELNLIGLINLGEKWDLTVIWTRDSFGSAITDSPLIEQNASNSLITSLTYRIK